MNDDKERKKKAKPSQLMIYGEYKKWCGTILFFDESVLNRVYKKKPEILRKNSIVPGILNIQYIYCVRACMETINLPK